MVWDVEVDFHSQDVKHGGHNAQSEVSASVQVDGEGQSPAAEHLVQQQDIGRHGHDIGR